MRYFASVFTVALSLVVADAQLLYIDFRITRPWVSSLRQVHVFFRHGERMPTSLYPNDPNKASDFKIGLGRISNKGKRDQFILGEQLRNRYDGFLTRDSNEVKARSSGRDRCLESMQTLLASLYKPDWNRRFFQFLDWQPVPIQSLPVELDGMLYEDALCKNDDEELEHLRTTGTGAEVIAKFKNLMTKLEKESGKKMVDWVSVRDLYDTIKIEKDLDLQVPSWADSSTLGKMEAFGSYTTLLNYKSEKRIRNRAGLMLKDMSLHFNDTVSNERQHKLYIYAAHDVLVAAFLSAFDAFNGLAVPPSTAVITELHEDSPGQFRVQMFFRNNTNTHELQPVVVPGCNSNGCSLSHWQEKVSRFIPSDWRAECGESPLPVKLYGRF